MDKPTFIRIAREMRALQKQWFGTRPENRPPDLLGKSKAAERRFDEAIEMFAQNQRGLFDREDG